ncbi:MAG: DUF2442 domain-containing protein [Bacteroidales bacterium]|nr:DUF2442 domain-containing protein [Bacteroidales bacterium]
MNLVWIVDAKIVDGYVMCLTFNDGCRRLYDFRLLLNGDNPLYLPLKDMAVFRKVTLDGWTVTWQDGSIDVAPEFLYEQGIILE